MTTSTSPSLDDDGLPQTQARRSWPGCTTALDGRSKSRCALAAVREFEWECVDVAMLRWSLEHESRDNRPGVWASMLSIMVYLQELRGLWSAANATSESANWCRTSLWAMLPPLWSASSNDKQQTQAGASMW